MAGVLDPIISRIESYIGEFLQSRQKLLDAQETINSAITVAQGRGSAKIGERVYTLAELTALMSENEKLLASNSDLHTRYLDWKEKVDTLLSAPEGSDPGYPAMVGIAGDGLGVFQIAVPAGVLVATGVVLAGALAMFISSFRSHISKVAGKVWSDLWLLAALGLGAYIYFNRRR